MTLKLLFIPGMMCDHRLFKPVLDLLPTDIPWEVCEIPNKTTIQGMAKDIGAKLQGEYIVIGLSLGGIIALEMYRYFAPQMKGMVLLNTTANADDPGKKSMRERQIMDVKDGNLRSVVMTELKPHYLADVNSTKSDINDVIMKMALEGGEAAFVFQSLALMSRRSSWGVLANLSCSVLIACGEEDRLCPPDIHMKMGECASDSQVKIYEGCGHLASLEVPHLAAGDILQFYETVRD